MRSLRGLFAWVTCAAALERLGRDLALAGMSAPALPQPLPGRDQAACAEGSPLLIEDGKFVLEEFEFTRTGAADAVAAWIAAQATDDAPTQERIRTHLAVLHDDDFSHFVRYTTEVLARVGLDYETKTVKTGALFYEEFLPPETLFYALVLAAESRSDHRQSASQVLAYVGACIAKAKVLQIGGDETIGRGLCAVRLANGTEK